MRQGKEDASALGQGPAVEGDDRGTARSTFRQQRIADRFQATPSTSAKFGIVPTATKERRLMCNCTVTQTVIDVRQIVPRMRHPLIFQTFDHLDDGESFFLVSDHDPRPLFYQFNVGRPGEFEWDYVEEGPDVWRIRIGRAAA